jgi:hypothetical protein
VIISERLDLLKGPSSYERGRLQHLLWFISKHRSVKPYVQLSLHKECLELGPTTIIGVKQWHLDLDIVYLGNDCRG